MCNFLEDKRNIEALLGKYFSNFWRNTSGSEIKSVAVKMSDMLEALKQVGNNLEEAWANLVQEHFSNPVLQVNYSNLITSISTPFLRTDGAIQLECFDFPAQGQVV